MAHRSEIATDGHLVMGLQLPEQFPPFDLRFAGTRHASSPHLRVPSTLHSYRSDAAWPLWKLTQKGLLRGPTSPASQDMRMLARGFMVGWQTDDDLKRLCVEPLSRRLMTSSSLLHSRARYSAKKLNHIWGLTGNSEA